MALIENIVVEAGNVSTTSGESVQAVLDGLRTVTPEQFMQQAGGNATAAFKLALSYAKANSLTFKAAGAYELEASATDPIVIEVDADMSAATVTCKTYQSGDVWSLSAVLFKVYQPDTDITSQLGTFTFLKGLTALEPLKGLSGSVIMESSDVVMLRDDGSPQLKAEVNELDIDGTLRYRNYYTYTSAPTLKYKPFLGNLTFKMPKVILDGARIRDLVLVERNNTYVQANTIVTVAQGSVRQPISLQRCARVSVSGLTASPVGYLVAPTNAQGRNEAAYAVLAERCSDVKVSNCSVINGWGGFDASYSRNIHIDKCDFPGIGGHFSNSDFLVTGCTVRYHCTAQGWGYWTARDCLHLGLRGKDVLEFFSVKRDYMSSWDGTITVEDLTVRLPSSCTTYMVVSSIEPKYNGNFMAVSPDVVIRDVSIDLSNATGLRELRVLDLGISGGNNFEQYMLLPNNHLIENVKVIGTHIPSANTTAHVVYNQRNYSSITDTQMQAIKGRGTYRLVVRDVDMRTIGVSPNTINPRYNVQTFKFTSQYINQDVSISGSYNCVPYISAWDGMTVRVSEQDMGTGYIDAAVARTYSSFNRIFYTNCRIYGLGWSASGDFRTGIFDFNNCIFGWMSTISGIPETSTQTIGLLFGGNEANNTVTGSFTGCRVMIQANPFQIADSTFRSRVQMNYINGDVYQIP